MRVFLAATAACFLAAAAWAEVRIVNSPGDGYLNLRTGPGSQYDIILPLRHGSLVEVLETKGSWSRVRHEASGNVGWAFRKYMVAFDGAAPVRFVYSPNDGYLNLRTGPGSGFAIVRRMFNGEAVEILERKGGWVRVSHQSGAQGWAFEKYLRK